MYLLKYREILQKPGWVFKELQNEIAPALEKQKLIH